MLLQTLDLSMLTATLSPLAAALRKLEIEPFDPAAVARYKTEKMDQTFEKLRVWHCGVAIVEDREEYTREVEYAVRRHLGEGAVIRYYEGRYPYFYVALVWLRWPVSPLAIKLGIVSNPSCTQLLPTFVVNKMQQIAAEVPTATFSVDELRSEAHSYDPFLIVDDGVEHYFIECWGDEEREFHRE